MLWAQVAKVWPSQLHFCNNTENSASYQILSSLQIRIWKYQFQVSSFKSEKIQEWTPIL